MLQYNYTNGSELWANRTTGLFTACANTFFSPYKNATNIMYEPSCEPEGDCDNDQFSFKAYLARWMAKSAVVAPYLTTATSSLLTRSAQAAAQACSGGINQTSCGQKWYVGGFDGVYGVGQELSALETVQALLLLRGDNASAQLSPQTRGNVHIVQANASTYSIPPQTSATATATPRSAAKGTNMRDRASIGAIGVWAIAALTIGMGMVFGGGVMGVR